MDPPRALIDAVRRHAQPDERPARRVQSSSTAVVPEGDSAPERAIWRARLPVEDDRVPVALLGAGDYARTEILPVLSTRTFARIALADREAQIAALASSDAGFALATTDAHVAIQALPRSGVVLVATYHDSHAELAAASLLAGHRVFLEKPAVVTEADLRTLVDALKRTGPRLELGFNRRYNPLVRRTRALLAHEEGPFTITCVVKEVALEPDHWYLWPNQGTRVTGNLCHWLDLGVYLMRGAATPVSVTASPAVSDEPSRFDEERTLSVTFDDGSLLSVVATGRGDDIRGVQELVDARRGRTTVVLDDLWKLTAHTDGRVRRARTMWRDKGHRRMFRESLRRLALGEPTEYALSDLVTVSVMQVAASRIVEEGEARADVEATARRWQAEVQAETGAAGGIEPRLLEVR